MVIMMCHTFELEMTSPKSVFKISQDFYPSYIPTKLQHHLTWIRKKIKICLFDHFSKHSPLTGYHGNNEKLILKLLILKDDLYNGLKSHKISWRSAKPFLRYLAKLSWRPSPPVQIGLSQTFITVCWDDAWHVLWPRPIWQWRPWSELWLFL